MSTVRHGAGAGIVLGLVAGLAEAIGFANGQAGSSTDPEVLLFAVAIDATLLAFAGGAIGLVAGLSLIAVRRRPSSGSIGRVFSTIGAFLLPTVVAIAGGWARSGANPLGVRSTLATVL